MGDSNFTGTTDYHGDSVIGYWRWFPEIGSCMVVKMDKDEAFLSIKQAEAEGIQKLLDAKAAGYKQLFEACGEDAKSAATMLLIEKLEEIVAMLDGEDQWFIQHYNIADTDGPACELPKRQNHTAKA